MPGPKRWRNKSDGRGTNADDLAKNLDRPSLHAKKYDKATDL
jgi:hypothetical protein